jgi:hypothetical protein
MQTVLYHVRAFNMPILSSAASVMAIAPRQSTWLVRIYQGAIPDRDAQVPQPDRAHSARRSDSLISTSRQPNIGNSRERRECTSAIFLLRVPSRHLVHRVPR